MRTDARSYFSSSQDVVLDRISAMETAYQGGNAAAINDAGLSVLARIGTALNETGAIKGTPADGDVLVKDVLLCSTLGADLPTGFSFVDALGPDGLFGVRGGAGDATDAVTSRGTTVYGAEPQTGKTWAGSIDKRFLMYGYLLSSFSTIEAAVEGAKPFDVSILPAVTFTNQILVGQCLTGETSYPIQHVSSILPNLNPSYCNTQAMAPKETSTGLYALVNRAAELFTPRPLYAFSVRGGSGGLISGLSPFRPVKVTAADVALTYTQQPPAIVTINKTFTVKLNLRTTTAPPAGSPAGTPTGTPLADVVVTLLVSGNSGSFTHPTPTTATTDADGNVSFAWKLDKTGGYTITASAPVLGGTKSVPSNMFNVRK